MSLFQKQQAQQAPPPSGVMAKMFSYLPVEKSMKKAFMSFGVCVLFLFVSLINIFSIVTNPASFVVIFNVAIIAALVGLAQWNGPQTYMNKIFEKQNIVKTGVLFGSMFGALWFSLVTSSYLLSLFFCIMEFNAIMLYFCNTFPMGKGSIRQVKEQAAGAALKAQVSSMF